MERWAAKIIALLIIFVFPFLATVLPHKVSGYVVRKGDLGRKVLSCLMCFGGGVFFATYILHMGPEVRYILDEALIKPNHIKYPLTDLIMAGGFFLVFFIEKITLKMNKQRQVKKLKAQREHCLQVNKNNELVSKGDRCDCEKSRSPNHNVIPLDIEDLAEKYANHCPLTGTGECCGDGDEVKQHQTEKEDTLMYHPESNDDEATVNAHNTRSIVLVVALSLHRIFEGMSVGLQHSASNVWNLLIAVMCHEIVIGFSMGLQFVKNGFRLKKMIITSLLCSIIMPVGVAVGTIVVEVGEEGNTLNIVNGVLQGVATGTFIYVTFFEILQEEIDAHDTSIGKLLSVFVGFAVMALLSLVPAEDPSLGIQAVNGINASAAVVNNSIPTFG